MAGRDDHNNGSNALFFFRLLLLLVYVGFTDVEQITNMIVYNCEASRPQKPHEAY